MSGELNFRISRGLEGLADVREDWTALEARHSGLRFYQTCAWYRCGLKYLFPEADVWWITSLEDDEFVGVFPLCRLHKIRKGIDLRCLEMPGHPHFALNDWLVDPAAPEDVVASGLIEFLREQRELRWDALRLAGMRFDGTASRLMLRGGRRGIYSKRTGCISEIACDGDSCPSNLAGPFRRNLRRLERRASQWGRVEFRASNRPDELGEATDLFIDIENDGWKCETGTSIASDSSLAQFYKSIATEIGEPQTCQVNFLYVDDVPVAAQFGFVCDRIYFILKIAYRQAYSKIAPGNLLMSRTMEYFHNRPEVDAVNLVTSPDWAEKWKSQCSPVCAHVGFNHSWPGIIARGGFESTQFLAGVRERLRGPDAPRWH